MDSENDLKQYVKRILADNPYKLVLSGADGLRETLRRLENGYQAERIVNRQAFQTNLTVEETYPYILSRFEEGYRQLNAWSESYEYNLRVAKRGRAMFSRKANKNAAAPSEQHNRVKNYILPQKARSCRRWSIWESSRQTEKSFHHDTISISKSTAS